MSVRTDTLRSGLFAAGAALALAGAIGLTQSLLFSQTSELKYAVSVIAPLLLVVIATSEEPLRAMLGITMVLAPFGAFVTTVGGFSIPLLLPLLAVASVVALLEGPLPRRTSRLGVAGAAAVALLALPLLRAQSTFDYMIILLTLVVMAWLTARVASEPGGLRFVLGLLVLTAAVQGGIAIWQVITQEQLNLYGSAGSSGFGPSSNYFFGFEEGFRPTGSFYDPISLGNVLALAAPPAVVLAATAREGTERLLFAALALVTGVALVLTLSRMSWLGALAGVAVAVALLPRGRRLAPGLAIVTMVALAVTIGLASGGQSVGDRFSSIFDPTDKTHETATGDEDRLRVWSATVDVALEEPVVGTGLGRLEPELSSRVPGVSEDTHAHSTYLQTLGEAGLLGLSALILVLLALGRDTASGLRRQPLLAPALAGSAVALAIVWSTDVVVRYLPVAALMAVVFGAAAATSDRRQSA